MACFQSKGGFFTGKICAALTRSHIKPMQGQLAVLYDKTLRTQLKPGLGKLLHTRGQVANVAVLGTCTHILYTSSFSDAMHTYAAYGQQTQDPGMQARGDHFDVVGGNCLPKASRVGLCVFQLRPSLPQHKRNSFCTHITGTGPQSEIQRNRGRKRETERGS